MNIVCDYWFSNPDYWITQKDKEKVDNLIADKFFGSYDDMLRTASDKSINLSFGDYVGLVIYLDQFSRHFQRLGLISENNVRCNRLFARSLFEKNYNNDCSEVELLFQLMLLKHISLERYGKFILNEICEYTNKQNRKIKDMKFLNRFFEDTYKKFYTNEQLEKDLICINPTNCKNFNFDKFEKICDFNAFLNNKSLKNNKISEKLHDKLKNMKEVSISISGGVDSNVLAYYLKDKVKFLIHIIYGNRDKSFEEYEMIKQYANCLDTPLVVYNIEFLKRTENKREFYEKMTRDIRFSIYKIIGTPIVLGHIQEDVVENIITNFFNGKELENLEKMSGLSTINDVKILRPLLDISKQEIYSVSEYHGISYLKNTTPEWSNRGKLRNVVYPVLNEHFNCLDEKLLYVAKCYKQNYDLVKKFVILPFMTGLIVKNNEIIGEYKYLKDMDMIMLEDVLTQIFYKYFEINKPSIKSLKNFKELIDKNDGKQDKFKCILSKDVIVKVNDNKIFLILN